MPGLLIDGAGRCLSADLEIVKRRVGAIAAEGNFLSAAIRYGFIFVRPRSSGLLVSLRPQFVSDGALFRLCDVIAARQPRRVMVCYTVENAEARELIACPKRAIGRVVEIVAAVHRPLPRLLLTSERRPLNDLGEFARGRLLPIFRAWEETRGKWSPELYERLRRARLLDCAIVTHTSKGSSRLIVDHWGARANLHGREWPLAARGRDFEDQPNIDLGVWAATISRQTIEEAAPRLHTVDMVLRALDRRLMRRGYARFALPWRAADGARVTLTRFAGRNTTVLE